MPNLPSITFDAATRAAQYIEVVVTANAVDQNTGANPGVVDTTTPLTFTYLSGGPVAGPPELPAAVTFTEVAQAPDGARILRIAPGAIPPGTPPPLGSVVFPWNVKVGAAGRTGTLTVTGSTPPIQDVSGVTWNGVGPQATQPS